MQQFEGFIAMGRQHPHAADDAVRIGIEVEVDGQVGELCLEGGGIETACPFVQQPGGEKGHALLARGILRRAAAESDGKRNQRIGVILDQPGLDPAGTDHAFDLVGRHGSRGQQRQKTRQKPPLPGQTAHAAPPARAL